LTAGEFTCNYASGNQLTGLPGKGAQSGSVYDVLP
jgi:hypothetical protein